MKKILALPLIAALCLCLTACGDKTAMAVDMSVETSDSSLTATTLATSADELFTDRDFEVGYSDYVTITLSGSSASCDGGGVSISGSTVTISQEGTYLLTGSLSGQIIVDTVDTAKVQLVLSGADVTCDGSAAIYCKTADKLFLTLAENTANSLSSTGDFVQTDENNVDGAIFSKCDLTLNGSGSLEISCQTDHGVVSKDDLKITGGTYIVTSASHGLSGKDSVRIADGTFTITAGKDGVHSENTDDTSKGNIYIADGTFTVSATGDSLDASNTITVLDGTFDLTTGGGSANASTKSDGTPSGDWGSWGGGKGMGGGGKRPEMPTDGAVTQTPDVTAATETENASTSAKGLKADVSITISGGDFTIDSSDDSIHTNGNLTVSGGTFDLSSGDDGMHADATLTILDGTIVIKKSYEGIEGAAIVISGGEIAVTSTDDGLNAAGGNDSSSTSGRMGQNPFDTDTSASILISGGTLTVDASGDGIDSNGSLTVTGGTVYVNGPTNSGNGAMDYGSTAAISGGTVIAVGAMGMDVNFTSESTQGSILCDLSTTQEAGATVTLTDADGSVLATYTPTKQYQSVVISAPGVSSGGSYTLTAGTETVTIEMTDTIYGSSNGMMGGMGGGRPMG